MSLAHPSRRVVISGALAGGALAALNAVPAHAGPPDSAGFINAKDAAYGAKGDNVTDDTAALQAAITAGAAAGIPVYFPPGVYRTKRLDVPAGAVLQGAGSGGHGIVLTESLLTTFALIAGTNDHLLHGAQGSAHVRIRDIHLDCNKNNNTSGNGIHLDDVGTAEEAQWHIRDCFIEAAAGYCLYIGTGRRGVAARDSLFMYAGASGIRINGSDAQIEKCLVGSNAVDGIQPAATVIRITDCDIWGNGTSGSGGNGIDVLSTISDVIIKGNGIDRNLGNGIYIGSGANRISIIGNDLHSNSQAVNGAAHHINVQTTTGGVTCFGNVFGVDGGMTKAAGYGIYLNGASVTVKAEGNILDNINAANLGLTNDFSRLRTKAERVLPWAPSGAQVVNMDRLSVPLGDVSSILTSGRLQLAGGLILPMGMRLTTSNKINVLAGNTGGASLTHLWFCLVDQSGNVLVKTTDDTSGSWSGNAPKSLALSSTYFATVDTPVYVGIVAVGTTMPSFRALNSSNVSLGGAGAGGDLPVVAGYTTDAALTGPTTLGGTIRAVTAVAANPFCWIS